jgi:hypothetical protein
MTNEERDRKTYKVLLIAKILAGISPYGNANSNARIVIPTTSGGVEFTVSEAHWRALLDSMGDSLIKEIKESDNA